MRVKGANRSEDLAALVGLIYEAAVDPALWPTFLGALADGFPDGVGMLYQVNRSGAQILVAGWDQKITDAYNAYYGDINPWIPGVRRRAAGLTTPAEAMLREEDLVKTEFFNDFLRPNGLGTGVGVTVSMTPGRVLAASVLFGKFAGETATADQVRRLALCAPHLDRAERIARSLATADLYRRVAEDSLDRLKVGAIVVTPEARALFYNRAAGRILGLRDGIAIGAGGRIEVARAADAARLLALVRGASGTSVGLGIAAGGTLALLRPSGLPALSLLVSPVRSLPDVLGLAPRAALLLVSDRVQQADLSAAAVAELYGLSPSEARVAAALASGQSSEEIAHRFGLQKGTVRQQIKMALAKTGTHRQGELVRLILTGPAPMAKRPVPADH